MRITVRSEHRFVQTRDGAIVTQGPNNYALWARYLSVFDAVRVVSRVRREVVDLTNWSRADGPGVTFTPVPYYVGPCQFLAQWSAVRKTIRELPINNKAVIMKVGSTIANELARVLRKSGH